MRTRLLVAAILIAAPAVASANAQFIIVNADAAGEGFNDPTPATPVGGNPGITVGEQRLNLFQYAADRWGEILDSAVPIRIQANFDPLTCTATSAVLGSAGAISVWSDFANAPVAGTWYNAALANKLAGQDLDPTQPEIAARFNSSLNGNPSCLGGGTWYYGFDHNEGAGQSDLLPVLMHEFGHGLGFQSFVSKSGTTIGQFLLGQPDMYLRWMYDNQTNKFWINMTDAERAASMKSGRHVVWGGPNLLAAAPGFLTPGTPALRVTAPAAIAGVYQVGEAAFGPRLTATPIASDLLYPLDTTSSTLGCSPYTAGSLTGRVVMIDRGTCGFTIKVKNAQDAGAIGVIIADNAAGTPPAGLGGADATITIPSVRITVSDAAAIKAQLATVVVPVSLALDLTILAGADSGNRVLLYTPDPIATGSNVSHFDTSTTPNTLMEPAINSDLTTSVDLALPVFRDIGWYPDVDVDLVEDSADNCVAIANNDQLDTDGDLVGDACDDDDDGDGVADATDNCRLVVNPGQENTDGDATGNACDTDDDDDTVLDGVDNCPLVANTAQTDRNTDGVGDACDDEDGDGRVDASDNCPDLANPNQENADADADGDACDTDDDNDGVLDAADNCPLVPNATQVNSDTDPDGDACDGDMDGDGVANAADNCPLVANPTQVDSDNDGSGDACETDADNDGVANATDNCPTIPNANQTDTDLDGAGDACDVDKDNDGLADTSDNCPLASNPTQLDTDNDGKGDACDSDDDNDTFLDATDNCPLVINFDQANHDADANGDACDDDDDGDGDLDAADNCPLAANADQLDTDHDGVGDACDIDDDADGVLDTVDNCPVLANIGQADTDNDNVGDACDPDDDGDSVADEADNCPLDKNPGQEDANHNGVGDPCDPIIGDGTNDDGCCSTNRGRPSAGWILIGIVVAASLRRRRRA